MAIRTHLHIHSNKCTTLHEDVIVLMTIFLFVLLAGVPLARAASLSDSSPKGNISLSGQQEKTNNDPFFILHNRPMSENGVLIPRLEADANTLPPLYIVELSRRLWPTDKSKAMEWFVVGMARAEYDALRCRDKSARQGVGLLPAFAHEVASGSRQNRKVFSEAGRRALQRADLYVDEISPMWVCKQGAGLIDAALNDKRVSEGELIRSASEWAPLREEVSQKIEKHLMEQEKLPDEPPPVSQDALTAVVVKGEVDALAKPDKGFAHDGLLKIGIESRTIRTIDSLIQPDGKIVVAMHLTDKKFQSTIGLARIRPDGRLDGTFGTGGIVATRIGPTGSPKDIAVLNDGAIVVASHGYLSHEKQGMALARHRPDGSLDEGFAEQGVFIQSTGSGSFPHALAIQPDGKILIGGSHLIQVQRPDLGAGFFSNKGHFFLLRLTAEGLPDPSFGEQGMVATDVGGSAEITGVAVQADGKIVATGTRTDESHSGLVVARYAADGALDKGFGKEGLVIRLMEKKRVYDRPTVSILPTGGVLISVAIRPTPNQLLILRLLPDGGADGAFGTDGTLMLATGPLRPQTPPVPLPDGKVLVAGDVDRERKEGRIAGGGSSFYAIGIARFFADGRPDTSLGPEGRRVVSVGAVTDHVARVMVEKRGRIIVVGNSSNHEDPHARDTHLVVLRLLP
ncbi:hypothetical protein SIID45300_00425 [Candidatus Magnetaquicoccaceae bacterium FCR-1]|uniref:Delta-60 repeat domain-containing protein n=2 Tax=Candidatus Magnetaquiglobus chichijimensis TaxID=3141448 RepID=A0ABQ0C5G6_9PROT